MSEKEKSAPVNKYASDREEAERLDLEAHARLEAGLIDSLPASDLARAIQAPIVEHQEERPSFWQAIRMMFR
jgi:hypothetical protein